MTETLEARISSKIHELIKKNLDGRDPSYTMESSLESIGLKDIEAAELIIEIEEEFGVNFDGLYKSAYAIQGKKPFHDNQFTVGELEAYVLKQKKE